MKKNIKYLIMLVLSIFLFGSIGVYALVTFESSSVSYDNSSSSLASTNVKEAIDELYTTCTKTATDDLLDKVDIVTKGDGLYKDDYEDRYFYKGANPNNYITFNNEIAGWRIISLEADGTIKMIKNDSSISLAWDTSYSTNWARPATLNTYLNETYYDTLISAAKGQITPHKWSIGKYSNADDLSTQISDENEILWYGKVGLVTVSEYIRANSNKSNCGTDNLNNKNYNTCKNTNWMFDSSLNWWTITASSVGNTIYVYYIETEGSVSYNGPKMTYGIRPVVYLSSETQITKGTGTKSDPFVIG